MPAHQRLRLDEGHRLQDRREPTIKQNEEQPIAIREPDATAHLALQNRNLSAAFSAASWPCGLDGDTSSLTRKMSRPIIVTSRYAIPSLDQTDEVFGTHTRRISRSAASGSVIEQSVQVITTVSIVLSASGIAVADPRSNSARTPFLPENYVRA